MFCHILTPQKINDRQRNSIPTHIYQSATTLNEKKTKHTHPNTQSQSPSFLFITRKGETVSSLLSLRGMEKERHFEHYRSLFPKLAILFSERAIVSTVIVILKVKMAHFLSYWKDGELEFVVWFSFDLVDIFFVFYLIGLICVLRSWYFIFYLFFCIRIYFINYVSCHSHFVNHSFWSRFDY